MIKKSVNLIFFIVKNELKAIPRGKAVEKISSFFPVQGKVYRKNFITVKMPTLEGKSLIFLPKYHQ
jgi:hypothetical protein